MNFDRISRHFRENTQLWFFFTKWLPAAILDDRSHFSPFQINTQFFILFTKWLPSAILDDRKSLLIAFLTILDQYEFFFSQNGCQRPFWMTENRFRSHFSPFQINTQLWFFFKFTKWLPADILDDRKLLSNAFLAISDQYATFFSKWPPAAILELRFGPFWMTEKHFRSHFSPFQINTQLFFLNGRQEPFWKSDLRQKQ